MKYSVKVGLQATKTQSKPIRIRISFLSSRVDVALGYSYETENWDSRTGYPRKRTKNASNQTAAEITMAINERVDAIEKYFQRCELDDIEPQAAELRRLCGARVRTGGDTLDCFFGKYMQELASRHYTENTMNALTLNITRFCKIYGQMSIYDVDDDILVRYTDNLVDQGLNNTTIIVYVNAVAGFVKWALEKACIKRDIRKTSLKIVKDDTKSYLEPEELSALYHYKPINPSEELAKDYFVFGSFTGLRYSDLSKLKKSELSELEINTMCRKTGKRVRIEINKYSKEIIDKYIGTPSKNLLPYISNSWLDMVLWQIFVKLGFDTPVIQEYWSGERLMRKEVPKYEILAIHSARRTFVVQCLKRGVPPLVVIRWTGHKDLTSLGPYIAIVDAQRKKEMQKLDIDL